MLVGMLGTMAGVGRTVAVEGSVVTIAGDGCTSALRGTIGSSFTAVVVGVGTLTTPRESSLTLMSFYAYGGRLRDI